MRDALDKASHSLNFILLTVGFFVCGIQIVFIGTHLPTYLQDSGLDLSVASWALSMVGLFNIIGSFMAGWLASYKGKSRMLACIYLLRSAVMVGFIMIEPTPLSAITFGAMMGLLWLSTVPLTSSLIVVFFGPAFLSMLYGVAFLSHQVGSFLGAWLGGWIYDHLGSYDMMWQIVIASGLFAFVINWAISEAKPPAAAASKQPAYINTKGARRGKKPAFSIKRSHTAHTCGCDCLTIGFINTVPCCKNPAC